MNPKEMQHGKVYHSDYSNGWLIRFSKFDAGDPDRILYLSCMDQHELSKSKDGDHAWGEIGGSDFREATPEEIYWLEEAEKAGKFIPKPKMPEINYSIF
jgi:hypothetical protein